MGNLERFLDTKNSLAGKVISVALTLLLATMTFNGVAFSNVNNAYADEVAISTASTAVDTVAENDSLGEKKSDQADNAENKLPADENKSDGSTSESQQSSNQNNTETGDTQIVSGSTTGETGEDTQAATEGGSTNGISIASVDGDSEPNAQIENYFEVTTEKELQHAIAEVNAADGGEFTIKMLNDITAVDSYENLELSKNELTLLGGGYTLAYRNFGGTKSLRVANGAVLNIGKDKITITGNTSDSGVYIYGGGTLNMYSGATIEGISTSGASGGCGVCVGAKPGSSGTFNMYGGLISKNVAQGYSKYAYDGAAVAILDGTFNMYAGTISENSAKKSGGGVCVYLGAFNMFGGDIKNNTAQTYGGGVCVTNGSFKMTGGSITDNSASYYGGGVFVMGESFDMNGGLISNNSAGYYGGGVAVYSDQKFTMSGNAAIHNNSGVLAADDILAFEGGSVELIEVSQKAWELDEKHGGPHEITGWFYDGGGCDVPDCEDDRWNISEGDAQHLHEPEQFTITAGASALALKAAYDNTYTVIYTDGVEDEEVFEDQKTEDLKSGDETPAFIGTPKREGYNFTGWDPTVSDTVTGDVIYEAQWELSEDPGEEPGDDPNPVDPAPDPDPDPDPDPENPENPDTSDTPGTPQNPGDNNTPGNTPTTNDGTRPAPQATATDDAPEAEAATEAAATEDIADDENPLAAFDGHPSCWVHWLIIMGIIVTAIYGAVVVAHRRKDIHDLDDFEDDVLGNTESTPATNPVTTGSRVSAF